jgi:hypothetical protein
MNNDKDMQLIMRTRSKVTLDENVTVLRNPENWRNMLSKFIM